MIRINLVRYSRRKKTKTFRLRVLGYLSFVLALIVLTLFTSSFADRITGEYEKDVEQNRRVLKTALNKVKEGSGLKKLYNLKKHKFDAIDSLIKNNKGSINLLKEVAKASEISRIRLSSFSINNRSLEIEGFSPDTKGISCFLRELKNINRVKDATLKLVDKNTNENYPKLRFLVICIRNS